MKAKIQLNQSSAMREEYTPEQEEEFKALSNAFISYPFVIMDPAMSIDKQETNTPSSVQGNRFKP